MKFSLLGGAVSIVPTITVCHGGFFDGILRSLSTRELCRYRSIDSPYLPGGALGTIDNHCLPLSGAFGNIESHCLPLSGAFGTIGNHCLQLGGAFGTIGNHCLPLSGALGTFVNHCFPLIAAVGTIGIGGTSQATAGFQDSDIFQKAIKMMFRRIFWFDFSPFRIQTFNPVLPMHWQSLFATEWSTRYHWQ